jgi:hypothetical protein
MYLDRWRIRAEGAEQGSGGRREGWEARQKVDSEYFSRAYLRVNACESEKGLR